MDIRCTSIGTIYTPFKQKEGMPIQSSGSEGARGTVKLKKKYAAGLLDIDKFSHIYLIYLFHRTRDTRLQVIPFLDDRPHGIFATRAPGRPNPIGISVVKLISVNDNVLEVENVDMLNGTPLLDIKPYVSHFDIHRIERNGWINEETGYPNGVTSDNRFD